MKELKNVNDFFNEVKSVSSTLKKVEIAKNFIRKYHGKPEFTLVEMYLNKDITFGFSKKQLEKRHDFARNSSKLSAIEFLNELANRNITGNEAIETYNAVTAKYTEEQEIALMTILTRESVGIDKKLFAKAYKQIFDNTFLDKFQPQLANKYSQKKNYNVKNWYYSPKLDGIRCIFRNGQLETRSGKKIFGFEQIEAEAAKIADKYNLEIIDGELYSHTVPFQTIQSYVVRNKNIVVENKKKIFFNVFAVVSLENPLNSSEMYNILGKIKDTDYIKVVDFGIIKNDWEAIRDKATEYVEQGYEGLMLRNETISYDYKRSDNLLKVKFFEEDDFVIVGFTDGTGKNKGTLGAVTVESKDGKIRSNVGTGFSDEMRDYIWNHQDEYLNKLAEIKYQGITDDGISLRFPVWTNKLKLDR